MPPLLNRQFWTFLLTLSGSLLLVSGLFLLFDLKSHLVHDIHQLVSIVFIAACAGHLVLNRKPLLKTIGGCAAVWTLFAMVTLAVVSMAFSDFQSGGERRHGEQRGNAHGISRH